jgi:flagellar hook-length control protein FliK
MTTSSSTLALLTALPSSGKNAPNTAGAGSHKVSRQVAETGIDPATTDAADAPGDSPNFAKLLREQTATEQAPEPSPEAAAHAKADKHSETADGPAVAKQTSEQLAAWLASLVRAPSALKKQSGEQGQLQVAIQGPDPGQPRAQVPLKTEASSETQNSEAVQTSHTGLEPLQGSELGQARAQVPLKTEASSETQNSEAVQTSHTGLEPLQGSELGQARARAPLKAEPPPETQATGAVRTSPEGLGNADTAVQAQALGNVFGANPAPQATASTRAAQLSRLAGQAGSGLASTVRSDAKTALAKGVAKAADKSEATDERAPSPATMASARVAAKATVEASAPRAAPAPEGGQKSLAAGAAVHESSAAVKSTAQRPGAADLSALPMALAGLTSSVSAGPASAAPASGAPATATPVVDTAVSQDIRRPEFVPVFSARIATLVQEGVEQARVHLNPVDMGPVSLQLSMDGMQVRVDMTAEVAATRLVLEQALPTLAGALREAGFTLSGGGVSPPAEAANLSGQDPRGAGGSQSESNPQASGQSTGLAGQQADGRRQPEAQAGRTPFTGASGTADGLTTELQLDAEGRPRLPQGTGLVDTFA